MLWFVLAEIIRVYRGSRFDAEVVDACRILVGEGRLPPTGSSG